MCNFYFCRKLKNRVAAQTARDRKKERMGELETIVARLESDVSALYSICELFLFTISKKSVKSNEKSGNL